MTRTERIAIAITLVLVVGAVGLFATRTLSAGGSDPQTEIATADPSPSPASTPTVGPTPSESPSPAAEPTTTATPTPTATVSEEQRIEAEVAALRETDLWVGLAEYDRAGNGRRGLRVGRPDGVVGPFANAEELWNSFAPELRDRMLRRVVTEGIEPSEFRFPGKPIQDDFVSGVLAWWTNGPTGTQGRGIMMSAQASYTTADGEDRRINWPVLVSIDPTPGAELTSQLLEIGPAHDVSMAETPNTYLGTNEDFNDHHLDWLFDQPTIAEAAEVPCPESGCSES